MKSVFKLLFPLRNLLFIIFFILLCFHTHELGAQILKGRIIDKFTKITLTAVSIAVYQGARISGSISNNEGEFQVIIPEEADSVKFSLIGYRSTLIDLHHSPRPHEFLTIGLEIQPIELSEVIVKPLTALDILTSAISATKTMMAKSNYENQFFYREIIKDRENYFSVSEAIFKGQFIPSKNDYKLKLEKGRSKEEVSYTRLFEDYHPGGGPEGLFNESLVSGLPGFLSAKKLKLFNYRKDSMLSFDGRNVYVIDFDQKPDVHEALDKGKVYIDANDFSIIKYESENSPLGTQYIKDLTGTDKLFAELLHIDFKRKGWVKKVEFSKSEGKLYLKHAFKEYKIGYKQPRKDLDLDLTITTEMVATETPSSIKEYITREQEWKSKNIVANLPTDFDADFWGNANIISPTAEINKIITTIGKRNNEVDTREIPGDWKYFKQDFFIAYGSNDSITLIPIMKGSWKDDQSVAMLYQSVHGDFSIEAELSITKRSDPVEFPNNGFQQAGIIVRDGNSAEENNLILAIGTGGNKNNKYFLRRTEKGKSKGPVDKINSLHCWLRIEKKGNTIAGYIKTDEHNEWKRIADYHSEWVSGQLEVGLMVMARFAGDGPK